MARFWRGKKRLAKKLFRDISREARFKNYYFNSYHKYGPPKVGGLTHDCDYENHVISRVEGDMYSPYGFECYYINNNGYETPVCTCLGQGWQVPVSKEQVEEYFLSHDTPEGRAHCEKWEFKYILGTIDKLKSGVQVFDERGVRLPEFNSLKQ